jgi:uncharacterized membrane protein YeaQ/YmgE (transglycosylase-associated protein family)
MIEKFFRGIVEGLGSKTVTLIFAGIVAALVAPVLFTKLGVSPEVTFDVLYGIGGVIVLGVLNRWHVDVSTDGKTTTANLLTLKALQAAEAKVPDGTPYDVILKQMIEAMQKAQGKEPAALAVPPPASPQ